MCEIILNFSNQCTKCRRKIFLVLAMVAILFNVAERLGNLSRGRYHDEIFGEIILIWAISSGGGVVFLFSALVAILFGGANLIRQIR